MHGLLASETKGYYTHVQNVLLYILINYALFALPLSAYPRDGRTSNPLSLPRKFLNLINLPRSDAIKVSGNFTPPLIHLEHGNINTSLTYDYSVFDIIRHGDKRIHAKYSKRCPSLKLLEISIEPHSPYPESNNLGVFVRMSIAADCSTLQGSWLGTIVGRNVDLDMFNFENIEFRQPDPEKIGKYRHRVFMLHEISILSLQELLNRIRQVPPIASSVLPNGPWDEIRIDKMSGPDIVKQKDPTNSLGYSFISRRHHGFTWLRMDLRKMCTRRSAANGDFYPWNWPKCAELPEPQPPPPPGLAIRDA